MVTTPDALNERIDSKSTHSSSVANLLTDIYVIMYFQFML
jgi:hypothetical protein